MKKGVREKAYGLVTMRPQLLDGIAKASSLLSLGWIQGEGRACGFFMLLNSLIMKIDGHCHIGTRFKSLGPLGISAAYNIALPLDTAFVWCLLFYFQAAPVHIACTA